MFWEDDLLSLLTALLALHCVGGGASQASARGDQQVRSLVRSVASRSGYAVATLFFWPGGRNNYCDAGEICLAREGGVEDGGASSEQGLKYLGLCKWLPSIIFSP